MPPNPATTWKAARWLVRQTGHVLPFAYAYVSGLMTDETEAPDGLVWVRAWCYGTQATPAGTVEDVAGFKLDIVNITDGAIDNSWITADYTQLLADLTLYLNDWKRFSSPTFTYTGVKLYAMSYQEAGDIARPFNLTGPPVAQSTVSYVGTGAVVHPAQVAASITLKTGFPRHWGRFYLPHYGKALDANGRFTAADVEDMSDAVSALFDAMGGHGFLPVVPIGQIDKVPFHALQGVQDVQVDDIPDVIRRRRPKRAAIRAHTD